MADASGVDPRKVWRAGREAALLIDTSSRGRLSLAGPSRQAFLHRITTNDIKALQPGQGVASLIVTQKGRIIERLVVLVRADDLLLITSDGGREEAHEVLSKYIVFEDVQIADRTEDTFQLGLCGPRAGQVLEGRGTTEATLFQHSTAELGGRPVQVATEPGPAGPAFIIMGATADHAAVRDDLLTRGAPAGLVEGTTATFEPLRVAAGLPAYGRELSGEWNPLEARQEDALSFDKGCYVGQEVIARLRTYDKVKRRLTCLEVEGGEPLAAGSAVRAPAAEGIITSSAPVPGEARTVALAVIGGDLDQGAAVSVGAGDAPRAARVVGEPATAQDVRQAAPEPIVPGGKRFRS